MTGTLAGWISVGCIALATMAIKASGPLLLGGRPLPEQPAAVIGLLAPALLAALVATSTFGTGQQLVLDARALGVVAASVAIALRAPTLLIVVIAAAAAAGARLLGID
jgi:branched-subunit amino acid transport protein